MKPSDEIPESDLRKSLDKSLMICGEAYQIVGALSCYTNTFDHPDVQRALDRLCDPLDSEDSDILPWPKSSDWKKPGESLGVSVEDSSHRANSMIFRLRVRIANQLMRLTLFILPNGRYKTQLLQDLDK